MKSRLIRCLIFIGREKGKHLYPNARETTLALEYLNWPIAGTQGQEKAHLINVTRNNFILARKIDQNPRKDLRFFIPAKLLTLAC